MNILSKDGEISRIVRKNELPSFMPDIWLKKQIVEEIIENNPTIGVEILLLYPASPNSGPAEEKKLVKLYNILQSISTLKGIEYYSASRKRMRIFYKDAYVIESPDDKRKKDDPSVHEIPGQSELYAFFKDSSFGNYVCHVEYFHHQRSFVMEMENLDQIWYTIIPIIKPKKLKSYTIIIPLDDHILFYGFSCLSATNVFNMAENRIESLYNRIKAIYSWFITHFS